jgi:hypothetical protein
LKKRREKKEATKREELERRGATTILTQDAAKAKAKKVKEVESSHKGVMKMVHALQNASSENSQDTCSDSESRKRKLKKTKTFKKADTDAGGIVPLGSLANAKGKKKKKTIASEVLPQGERKVPEAKDKHGCIHHGLMDLLALPKGYLKTYVKVGGWLHNKPCKDCATKVGGSPPQVLDVSSLLKLKGVTEVGYYCNCGPVGHMMNMEEQPTHKKQWTCDMFLCIPCYDGRMSTMGEGGVTKRIRRKRCLD